MQPLLLDSANQVSFRKRQRGAVVVGHGARGGRRLLFPRLSEQHFFDVVQGEEFLGLSLQQVCSLISSDKLTVTTEEKVPHAHTHDVTIICFH